MNLSESNYLSSSSKLKKRISFGVRENKKILKLLLIIPLIIITLFLIEGKGVNAEEKAVKSVPAKSVGYIVEFKEEPVYKSLPEEGGVPESKRASVIERRAELKKENQKAKADILSKLGKQKFDSSKSKKGDSKLTLRKEFTDSFNGIAISADDDQIAKIKSSPYVKSVKKDLEVKSTLSVSVPYIGADTVWANIKDSQTRSVTGKDVNIGIVDGGVDYNNPDLGSTPFQERTFQKTAQPGELTNASTVGQGFIMDANKITYITGDHTLATFTFSTSQTATISADPGGGGSGIQIATISGQKLVFVNYSATEAALFYKNLSTGSIKRLSNLTPVSDPDFGSVVFLPRLWMVGDKVIFEKNTGQRDGEGEILTSIYSYNLNTDALSQVVSDTSSRGLIPVISGDKMIYSVISSSGAFTNYLYNFTSGTKQQINLPNIGKWPEDFRGNSVLYKVASGGAFLNLYNLSTQASTLIPGPADAEGEEGLQLVNEADFGVNVPIGVSSATIGSSAVFYSLGNLWAYDLAQAKTSKITIKLGAGYLYAVGNKVCFEAGISDLNPYLTYDHYCHNYDTNYSYPLPTQIFNSKVTAGFNLTSSITNIDENDPMDDTGHGTHVAGIAAGNGLLKGVAPDAKITAYKVMTLGIGHFSDVIEAFDKAIETRTDSDPNNDIDILNLSLGANCGEEYTEDCGPEDAISTAVNNTVDAGIVVVIAAGNHSAGDDTSIASPGTAAKAITVASVGYTDVHSYFSNIGPVFIGATDLHKPDVSAPGENICSAWMYYGQYQSSYAGNCMDANHGRISGTSMAAPHVAGLAALLLQKNPSWTPAQVKTAIKNNALDSIYDYDLVGEGRIDAEKTFGIKTAYINPGADSYVQDSTPTTNYGLNIKLDTDTSPKKYSYIRFNLSSLAGKTIISAKFKLKVADPSSHGQNLKLADDQSWTEQGITYNNRPSFVSTILSFDADNDNEVLNLNVKSTVNSKKGNLVAFGVTSDGNDFAEYYSRDSTNSDNRPQLIVEYQD